MTGRSRTTGYLTVVSHDEADIRHRGDFLVVVAEHAHDSRWGGVPALLAGGDDEPGGDVAQAELLAAEVEGDGEHGVVGDGGAADGLAAVTGRLVTLHGAVADVLALAGRDRGGGLAAAGGAVGRGGPVSRRWSDRRRETAGRRRVVMAGR